MNRDSWLRKWGPLALISALGLFLELAVIRWLSAEVRLFAYLKNISLLAAFLGLSVGFGLAGKGRDYKPSFMPLLGTFTVLVLAVGSVSSPRALIYPSKGDEYFWYLAPVSYWISLLIFLGTVAIFFVLTLLLFIPLGQATGEEMNRHMPTRAYIVNILASLVGVWLFSLVSYLRLPPWTWYLVFLSGVLGYFAVRERRSWVDLTIAGAILLGVAVLNRGAMWSPYSRLSLQDHNLVKEGTGELVKDGYILNVQQVFYQNARNLSDAFVSEMKEIIPGIDQVAYQYSLQYKLRPPGSKVLIVGAGMGNDASAALRNQMGEVQAVEIDPVILELGRKLHPEHPYDDPRVHAVVDDARSFFEKDDQTYDIIAFGLLDSHSLLSSLSSVRLDSYVYTLDSFQKAKEHLASDGFIVLTFAANTEWIYERLGRMLQVVFGADQVWEYTGELGNTFVAAMPGATLPEGIELIPWSANPDLQNIPLPTDDWPYLYLRGRIIPAAYWQTLLVVGLLAFLILRRSFPEAFKPDWHLWLLGAAFLLIEFTSITKLALLFGTTWLVNALAISGVLVMILVANLIVLKTKRVNIRLCYGLLFATIVLVYFFPFGLLNALNPVLRGFSGVGLLSLPLFFSGLIFAESLRRLGSASGAFASNLSGSVAGGILEYTSIWWGVGSLYLVGGILYVLAMFTYLLRKSST